MVAHLIVAFIFAITAGAFALGALGEYWGRFGRFFATVWNPLLKIGRRESEGRRGGGEEELVWPGSSDLVARVLHIVNNECNSSFIRGI